MCKLVQSFAENFKNYLWARWNLHVFIQTLGWTNVQSSMFKVQYSNILMDALGRIGKKNTFCTDLHNCTQATLIWKFVVYFSMEQMQISDKKWANYWAENNIPLLNVSASLRPVCSLSISTICSMIFFSLSVAHSHPLHPPPPPPPHSPLRKRIWHLFSR